MNTVHIALLGTGFAARFHAEAYRRIWGVQPVIHAVLGHTQASADAFAAAWGIPHAETDLDAILRDPAIDLVDIALPPRLHAQTILHVLEAGKSVACEKPLTGYFGRPEDPVPIGACVSRQTMYDRLLPELDALRTAVQHGPGRFFYAENYLYAPSIVRAGELLKKKESRILCIRAEVTIRGSTSPVAGSWAATGGGALIRLGCHPIAAILYLKQQENPGVSVREVLASTACISKDLTEKERRHLTGHPEDVEDFASLMITFTDDTKALVVASDHVFGGIRNQLEIFTNDGSLRCTLTPERQLESYWMDGAGLEGECLSEQLQEVAGWNTVSVADTVLRGYQAQFQDFVECTAFGREPVSGIEIACQTTQLIYAAYCSAQQGSVIRIGQ